MEIETTAMRGGSTIHVHSAVPCLQLAKLLELLGAAWTATASGPASGPPVLEFRQGRLTLHADVVIDRLLKEPEFRASFAHGSESGFVRHLKLPPWGTSACVGGELAHSPAELSQAIQKLHTSVASATKNVLQGLELARLTSSTLPEALQAMHDGLQRLTPKGGIHLPKLPEHSCVVPLAFAPAQRSAEERSQDVAKVYTAIETIENADFLGSLASGIAARLRKTASDFDDEEIQEIENEIRQRGQQPGSQVQRFVDFLEDQALARVRQHITMEMMQSLAAHSDSAGLKAYVQRVRECFDAFAGEQASDTLQLNASSAYGEGSISNLGEHLQKALFYSCLPVWAQGSAQLFETRKGDGNGLHNVREVSYRFRVNGINPEQGVTALQARIDRLRERLALPRPDTTTAEGGPAQTPAHQVGRDIAEVVFLYLVIPDSATAPEAFDLRERAQLLDQHLQDKPREVLGKLLRRLDERCTVMQRIASDLVRVLRSKGESVFQRAAQSARQYTISVHRDIVRWEALHSLTPNTEILISPALQDERSAWLRHLSVRQQPVIGASVLSFTLHTELLERSLARLARAPDPPLRSALLRELVQPVLPVRLVPSRWSHGQVHPLRSAFDTGCGIEVRYDLRQVRRTKTEETPSHYRAAAISALTVLLYVFLWEIQRCVQAARPGLSTTLVRLQEGTRKTGAAEDDADPNTVIYAITQALETSLAREGHTKLQGMSAEGDLRWKISGTLAALLGGQPMSIPFTGNLDKVALLTYATRACDSHPALAYLPSHVFTSRAYVADRMPGTDQARLRVAGMRCDVVQAHEFTRMLPVQEEISRLRALGYEHIMLLSHHQGSRRLGRAAERHCPHGSLDFWDTLLGSFADLHLYPLRRDVFPATRLRTRASDESAFEVPHFQDHTQMYGRLAQHAAFRSVMPVYTFATLAVVGDSEQQRPQSGFCTYFLDQDQRLGGLHAPETAKMNLLGLGHAEPVRHSLISVLRGIHFLESEKAPTKDSHWPVLDPFAWANPVRKASAGEVPIFGSRRKGQLYLSLPAVLARITPVLHKHPAQEGRQSGHDPQADASPAP